MKAWRASVCSALWVLKKSGHSTTKYRQTRTPALNNARWCLRKRHHTNVQFDATAIRSSAADMTCASDMALVFHPDARIDQGEQNVGQQRADDGQERVDQQDAAGEIHVLIDQRAQQQRT